MESTIIIIRNAIISLLILITFSVRAQFPPPAGQTGSTAIYSDSSIFVNWATNCIVERGFFNIADTSLGLAYFGDDNNVIGKANNSVVSLGDGGIATLTFNTPISNGNGFDFAIFENSFSDDFLELAFVEVSSNGTDFFRFKSTSLTQTDNQVGTFGTIDATKINNLAGKYKTKWGTPFDLEELSGIEDLDISNITTIRVIDVVGSIVTEFASYDSDGNIINDPWPTPFETSGFDLDAVGVINNRDNTSVNEINGKMFSLYPVPADDCITITSQFPITSVEIISLHGTISFSGNSTEINISDFKPGLYIITATIKGKTTTQKFLKK